MLNRKYLIQKAKGMRRNMTEAERLLWKYLRAKRMAGFKFRRQDVIGNYIVDFVCRRERLVIEIDGGQHAGNTEYDRKRTDSLKRAGYKVLRFWNNEILGNIEGVLETILKELKDR